MRSRPILPTVFALAAILALPATGMAGGNPQASFSTTLGGCYVQGTVSDIAGNQLRIKHRSANGALKKTHTFDVPLGVYEIGCPGPGVVIADSFQFFEGSATTPFRTFTVPELTLRTDRFNDRVSGTATRAAQVYLSASTCDAAFFGCTSFPAEPVPVDPTTQRFARNLPEDITGTWSFDVRWEKGGDSVWLHQRVAGILVRPGSAVVGRAGALIGRSVVVSVRRGQKTGIGTATTKQEARFSTTIRRSGSPMPVRAGDLVSSDIAADATLVVPATSISLDGGFVVGRCFKSRRVTVLLYDAGGAWKGVTSATSNATGHWTTTAAPSAGWRVQAWCANVRGDTIRLDLLAN